WKGWGLLNGASSYWAYILAIGVWRSVLSALLLRNSISVGASGALFGLLGSMLSELITNWTIYSNKAAALLTLLFIIAINLAIGILPHVDNFAHIGGFLTGFLLVCVSPPRFGWNERHDLPLSRQMRSNTSLTNCAMGCCTGSAVSWIYNWFSNAFQRKEFE
ncbi:RHOMBOID-like protein 3, partial [Ananas comosus]